MHSGFEKKNPTSDKHKYDEKFKKKRNPNKKIMRSQTQCAYRQQKFSKVKNQNQTENCNNNEKSIEKIRIKK